MQRDSGLEKAIVGAGGVTKLADGLGISSQAVSQWERVPAERVIDTERLSGIDRTVIRPDLYPPPKPSKRRAA